MTHFITKNIENDRIELMIDVQIFPIPICMKAAYSLLDKGYFFFHTDDAGLLVQIHSKPEVDWTSEKIAMEYSDELLATALRDRLEKENKTIRETIVRRALGSFADLPNFVSSGNQNPKNWQIDFDKDIDEILREIENDPELKIDEAEISRILAEIETETQQMQKEKVPKINHNKIKDAKAKFQIGK